MDKSFPQPPLESPNVHQPNITSPTDKENKVKLLLRKMALWQKILITSALLLFIGVVSVLFWYFSQLASLTKEPIYHVITINQGESTKAIAEDLERKALIRSSTAFQVYLRVSLRKPIQAGSYRLSSSQTAKAIASDLVNGSTTEVNILIPPGLRLDQIETRLKKAGYTQEELDDAYKTLRQTHPLVKNLPKNTTLEGYIFPDTYKIGPETTAEQLIKITLDTFSQKISSNDLTAKLKKQGLNLHQAIILASIVQQEVADYPTQTKVAQVFLKRLDEGRELGSDVTFFYAAEITGQTASPDLDSPYNTRKYAGLPPGPIGNFNLTALEAVAKPSNTTYNYFVAGDDGTTHFSYTLEQHQELTRKYCIQLCQLP